MQSKGVAQASICECRALLPVLVLVLPQASLVPASTKALEPAEQGCGHAMPEWRDWWLLQGQILVLFQRHQFQRNMIISLQRLVLPQAV